MAHKRLRGRSRKGSLSSISEANVGSQQKGQNKTGGEEAEGEKDIGGAGKRRANLIVCHHDNERRKPDHRTGTGGIGGRVDFALGRPDSGDRGQGRQ